MQVNQLKGSQSLIEQEFMNGDIVIIQMRPRGRELEDERADFWWYNSPKLPMQAPDYFNYLVNRRMIRLRPGSPKEQVYLDICAAHIKDKGMEVPDRFTIEVDQNGKPYCLRLEVSVEMYYSDLQEMLSGWFGDVREMRDPTTIRLTVSDGHDDMRRTRHYTYVDTDRVTVGMMLSSVNSNYRSDQIVFDVLPFSLRDLEFGLVKDVVLIDEKIKMVYREVVNDRKHYGEASEGEYSDCESMGAEDGDDLHLGVELGHEAANGRRPYRVRHRCILDPNNSSSIADPPVLSVVVPKHSTVERVLSVIKKELGLEGEDAGFRMLSVACGRVNKVFPMNGSAEDLHPIAMQEIVQSSAPPWNVLEQVDPLEIQLHEVWRHRLLSQIEGFADEGGHREIEMELRNTEFAPLQITFLNLQPEHMPLMRPSPKLYGLENGQSIPSPSSRTTLRFQAQSNGLPYTHLGCPLVSIVTSLDESHQLLERLSEKLGKSVETLRSWMPVLVFKNFVCPLPEGDEDEEKNEGGEQETAPPPGPSAPPQPEVEQEVLEKRGHKEEGGSDSQAPHGDVDNGSVSHELLGRDCGGEKMADGERKEEDDRKRKIENGPEEEREEDGGSDGFTEAEMKKQRRSKGTRLWRYISQAFPGLICRGSWDVQNWMEAPQLTFLRADGITFPMDQNRDDWAEPRRKVRRYDQGIKIRDS